MNSVIRYIDAHCALGHGLKPCIDNLLLGKKPLSSMQFDSQRDPVTLPYFSFPDTQTVDIYQQLETICHSAIHRSELSTEDCKRTAILLGSSCFDVQVSEAKYSADLQVRGYEQALPMPIVGYGKIAERLRHALELSPHAYTYSTACSSSANALLNAHRLLQAGIVDHALVIGMELSNHTTLLGFHGLSLLSPTKTMRPFEEGRDGMLLGEALSVLILSRKDAMLANQKAYGELCGGAIGVDNHSLTSANDDGFSLSDAMTAALKDASITAEEIVGIKAHGTASLKSDDGEAAALQRQFNQALPQTFTLKPFCGHTLGASGALETSLTLGCLARGVLPGNPFLTENKPMGIPLLKQNTEAPTGHYLFNFFAFGGNNNVFIIKHTGVNT